MGQLQNCRRITLGISFALGLLASSTAMATPRVVASIKPLHALAALVMGDLGKPELIIKGQASPHTYSLKPSDAEMLQQAEVIFWIGPELENFLAKPIASLGSAAKVVDLFGQSPVKKLPLREGNGFDHHDHGDAAETGHEEFDAHIWLDPENAKLMLDTIAETLASSDPAQAAVYAKNAAAAKADIDRLDRELRSRLAPAKDLGFIVFHDAYQYFERHYGLAASGAISINPENPPGAAGIVALQERVKHSHIACVFAEPQFDNSLVTLITEGTKTRLSTLDPLGVNIESGPGLYSELLTQLTASFVNCAGP
jgi:zinc transport system substrate-binding protein